MNNWAPVSTVYVYAPLAGVHCPVGIITGHGPYVFTYAQSWLAASGAFALDPVHLPLSEQPFSATRLWGVFEDGTPDAWGRKVMLAAHRQQPGNVLEWLLAARGAGVGCLLFSAARSRVLPTPAMPALADLEHLLAFIEAIDNGGKPDGLDGRLSRLLVQGSFMGGARPKLALTHAGGQWLVKFSRADDRFDQPRAEAACLMMAAACGIEVPVHQVHRLNGRSLLLVKRFDRVGGAHLHYLSANSLIAPQRARDGDPEGPLSYLRLCQVIEQISPDAAAELADLFRRMVFNIAIGNTDDHLKNHGFLYNGDNTYRLSPAFDLLPHPGQSAKQALAVGKDGRAATFANALSMCARFGLSRAAARAIIEQVLEVTARAVDYFQSADMRASEQGSLVNICLSKTAL